MLPKGANLQKIRNGNKTYAVTPHLPGGFVKPEVLEKYAQVARKYEGTLKLTSAQRIMITNLKAEDIESIWVELGMQPAMGFANCVRSVKVCPGTRAGSALYQERDAFAHEIRRVGLPELLFGICNQGCRSHRH